jgi:hypothetical protein
MELFWGQNTALFHPPGLRLSLTWPRGALGSWLFFTSPNPGAIWTFLVVVTEQFLLGFSTEHPTVPSPIKESSSLSVRLVPC